jgi:protein ImuB
MYWIACHFPRLPLETFLRGLPSSVSASRSLAIVDDGAVLMCNEHAQARGIRRGISLSTAHALVPQLETKRRDPALEAATLARLAAWCGQFTPNVAPDSAGFCLLDVGGSLRLFDGITSIISELRKGFSDLGFSAVVAAAPTARGAQLLARAGREIAIGTLQDLAVELGKLAVHTLDCTPATFATLRAVGVNTLADCLRLPRSGLARRCGQPLLDDLDRALGRLPDPRKFFVPPERFTAKLELPAEVEHAEALLFAVRRLLVELSGFLAARAGGVQRITLGLLHGDAPDTNIAIGLSAPGRDVTRLSLLAGERLTRVTLKQPVRAITLCANEIVPLPGRSLGLFRDGNETDDRARLIERLRARLGPDAVYGITVHPDHRPERAWHCCEPGATFTVHASALKLSRTAELRKKRPAPKTSSNAFRPVWLLRKPRLLSGNGGAPQFDGPLVLLSGPERLEAGWWDGADIARDYFIARTPGKSLLWVYRQRREPAGWYLHGIFG